MENKKLLNMIIAASIAVSPLAGAKLESKVEGLNETSVKVIDYNVSNQVKGLNQLELKDSINYKGAQGAMGAQGADGIDSYTTNIYTSAGADTTSGGWSR